jgi:hypothetical protein
MAEIHGEWHRIARADASKRAYHAFADASETVAQHRTLRTLTQSILAEWLHITKRSLIKGLKGRFVGRGAGIADRLELRSHLRSMLLPVLHAWLRIAGISKMAIRSAWTLASQSATGSFRRKVFLKWQVIAACGRKQRVQEDVCNRLARMKLHVNSAAAAYLLQGCNRNFKTAVFAAWRSASQHNSREHQLLESISRNACKALWRDRRGTLIQVLAAWLSISSQLSRARSGQQARARMAVFALWNDNRGVLAKVITEWRFLIDRADVRRRLFEAKCASAGLALWNFGRGTLLEVFVFWRSLYEKAQKARASQRARASRIAHMERMVGLVYFKDRQGVLTQILWDWHKIVTKSLHDRTVFEAKARSVMVTLWSEDIGIQTQVLAAWRSLQEVRKSRILLQARDTRVARMGRMIGVMYFKDQEGVLTQILWFWHRIARKALHDGRLFEAKCRSAVLTMWNDNRGIQMQVLAAWRLNNRQAVRDGKVFDAKARYVSMALWHDGQGFLRQVYVAWRIQCRHTKEQISSDLAHKRMHVLLALNHRESVLLKLFAAWIKACVQSVQSQKLFQAKAHSAGLALCRTNRGIVAQIFAAWRFIRRIRRTRLENKSRIFGLARRIFAQDVGILTKTVFVAWQRRVIRWQTSVFQQGLCESMYQATCLHVIIAKWHSHARYESVLREFNGKQFEMAAKLAHGMHNEEEMAAKLVAHGRLEQIGRMLRKSHRALRYELHYIKGLSGVFGAWSRLPLSGRLGRQLRAEDSFTSAQARLSYHRADLVTRCFTVSGQLLLREAFACWRQLRLARLASVRNEAFVLMRSQHSSKVHKFVKRAGECLNRDLPLVFAMASWWLCVMSRRGDRRRVHSNEQALLRLKNLQGRALKVFLFKSWSAIASSNLLAEQQRELQLSPASSRSLSAGQMRSRSLVRSSPGSPPSQAGRLPRQLLRSGSPRRVPAVTTVTAEPVLMQQPFVVNTSRIVTTALNPLPADRIQQCLSTPRTLVAQQTSPRSAVVLPAVQQQQQQPACSGGVSGPWHMTSPLNTVPMSPSASFSRGLGGVSSPSSSVAQVGEVPSAVSASRPSREAAIDAAFNAIDTDGDGFISRGELERFQADPLNAMRTTFGAMTSSTVAASSPTVLPFVGAREPSSSY